MIAELSCEGHDSTTSSECKISSPGRISRGGTGISPNGKKKKFPHRAFKTGGVGVPSRGFALRAGNSWGQAGALAGAAHHRGRWWTATRAQAMDAPDTLSQVPSHLRLPLGGSLPHKRPSEKPCIERKGPPLTPKPLAPEGNRLKCPTWTGENWGIGGTLRWGVRRPPPKRPHEKPRRGNKGEGKGRHNPG